MPDLIGPCDVVIGNQKWTFPEARMQKIREILTEGDVDPVEFSFSGPQLGEQAACNILAHAGYEIRSPRQISDAEAAAARGEQLTARAAQTRDTELRDLQADRQKMENLIYDLKRELADVKAESTRPRESRGDLSPAETPEGRLAVAVSELDAACKTIERLKDEVTNLRRERGLE